MSCNYAEGLSEYENKGRLGAPEKFDTVDEVTEKVDQLVHLVQQAKHIGRAALQTQAQIIKRLIFAILTTHKVWRDLKE
jgi:hypothetical protein